MKKYTLFVFDSEDPFDPKLVGHFDTMQQIEKEKGKLKRKHHDIISFDVQVNY